MKYKFAVIVLIFLSGLAYAIECPPSFDWSRLSGVGCMQKDCSSSGGSYSYTGSCICRDSKACYEPVDYTSFDKTKCGPHCPTSKLIACVSPDSPCPNEKPTPESCKKSCKSYHGPHGTGDVSGDVCDCSCEPGYSDDESLMCTPTKKTCDRLCIEYHGPNSYGTPKGISCDCSCKKGYAEDNNLMCVKVTCDQDCKARLGEQTSGTGSWPDCKCECNKCFVKHHTFNKKWTETCLPKECPKNSKCDSKTGDCKCVDGFYEKPLDGFCVKKIDNSTCGNGICDIAPKINAVIEDCELCPQDCGCELSQVCNPDHPSRTIENKGCVKPEALIVGYGCADGFLPFIKVIRARDPKKLVNAQAGMGLGAGDKVWLMKNVKDPKPCRKPWVKIRFGNVDALAYLGAAALDGEITIKENAVESGWRSGTDAAKREAWSTWELSSNLIKTTSVSVVSFFTNPSTVGEQDMVKVYVKSHIIVNHTPQGIKLYTLDGKPEVEYGDKRVVVEKGMKISTQQGEISNPEEFKPSEVGDWYLRIPKTNVQEVADSPKTFSEVPEKYLFAGMGILTLIGGGFIILAILGIIFLLILKILRK